MNNLREVPRTARPGIFVLVIQLPFTTPPIYLTTTYPIRYNTRMQAIMSKSLHDNFCANVKARRLELDLTQQALAKRAGMAQPRIAEIESGSRVPTLPVIERVARGLKTTAAKLLENLGNLSKT